MKCHNCKNEIPDNSKFCLFCGAPIETIDNEQKIIEVKNYSPEENKEAFTKWFVNNSNYEEKQLRPTLKCLNKASGWAKCDIFSLNTDTDVKAFFEKVLAVFDLSFEEAKKQVLSFEKAVNTYRQFLTERQLGCFDIDSKKEEAETKSNEINNSTNIDRLLEKIQNAKHSSVANKDLFTEWYVKESEYNKTRLKRVLGSLARIGYWCKYSVFQILSEEKFEEISSFAISHYDKRDKSSLNAIALASDIYKNYLKYLAHNGIAFINGDVLQIEESVDNFTEEIAPDIPASEEVNAKSTIMQRPNMTSMQRSIYTEILNSEFKQGLCVDSCDDLAKFKSIHLEKCNKLPRASDDIVLQRLIWIAKENNIPILHERSSPDLSKDDDSEISECTIDRCSNDLSEDSNEKDQECISILTYVSSLENERWKFVLTNRLEGKTLEETGALFGKRYGSDDSNSVTRERIRQIEQNVLRHKPNVYEDQYQMLFQKYQISKEDFAIGFKEPEYVYTYLNMAYKRGKTPIDKLLEDTEFPIQFRRAAERITYKNYVSIGNERVRCDIDGLSEYLIKTEAVENIVFSDFLKLYDELLDKLALTDKEKYRLSDGRFENKIQSSNLVLWKQWKTMRSYNICANDYTELLEGLNFEEYINVEISSLKLFRENPELMKMYDIRDEYELHNLLKKILDKNKWPNVHFQKMPTIEFGNVNREKQITELLISSSPIEKDAFYSLYEQKFGIKAASAKAHAHYISQYLQDGIYKIDLPIMPDIMVLKLKGLLSEEYYSLDSLIGIFSDVFPTADKKLINSYNLDKLGFKPYSSYVISKVYSSATDYFNKILARSELFSMDEIPNSISDNMTFLNLLNSKRRAYDILEISHNQFLNLSKFNKIGIEKSNFFDYVKSVFDFVQPEKHFTIYSINNRGFEHELYDLGFDEWFYSSLVIADKNRFSYIRIGGTHLIKRGTSSVLLSEFIEEIVYEQDELSIEIYDLIENLRNVYGIIVDKYKVLESIKNSDMYYDKITEKVYAEYDIYFEEV